AEKAAAMNLDEIAERGRDDVVQVRPAGMARDENAVPGVEVCVRLAQQRLQPLLELLRPNSRRPVAASRVLSRVAKLMLDVADAPFKWQRFGSPVLAFRGSLSRSVARSFSMGEQANQPAHHLPQLRSSNFHVEHAVVQHVAGISLVRTDLVLGRLLDDPGAGEAN